MSEDQEQIIDIVKLEDGDGFTIVLPFVKRGIHAIERIVGVGTAVIGGDKGVALGLEGLSLCHKFFINVGEAEHRGDGSRIPGTGTPGDIRDDIQRFVDIGYERFIVRYRGGDTKAQRVQLETFMAQIMAKV